MPQAATAQVEQKSLSRFRNDTMLQLMREDLAQVETMAEQMRLQVRAREDVLIGEVKDELGIPPGEYSDFEYMLQDQRLGVP